MDIREIFNQHHDDYLKFNLITSPLHTRPDLCAFLLLDKLVPGSTSMISDAGYDEIFLEVSLRELEDVASEQDIITLIRCGVRISDQCLAMFT